MKILELRFKNLNSLYGEWSIDFTSPEYTGNGIFAITGPTGAGKSTIMDAICLALYGATPRLGKITASGNEIMSRQTGECYAEVTFESQAGRFRCHWSQHRARKNADGKLAESRHEIADAISGKILECKKRDVAAVIDEKTGMDFDRFTRSILLAQGSFAAFLQAAPDERAPVLEQITGTEIYSDISRRTHERQREERDKLGILQAETAGITLLTAEEASALQSDLDERMKAERTLSASLEVANQAIQWLAGIDSLTKELAGIAEEEIQIQKALEAFIPQRERLSLALRAADLEGGFAARSALRKQQLDDREALGRHSQLLPQLEADLAEKAAAMTLAEAKSRQVKDEQRKQAPLIQETRSLDIQLAEKWKTAAAAEAECRKLETKIQEYRTSRQKAAESQAAAQVELKGIDDYLVEHAVDESLVAQLAGITEQMNTLRSIAGDISTRKSTIAEEEKKSTAASEQLKALQSAFSDQEQKQKKAHEAVVEAAAALQDLLGERLLRECRNERDSLMREMAFIQRITSLETERKQLADGQPCPLCGSLDHPFSEGNLPEADALVLKINDLSTLIDKADQMETNIKQLESLERAAAGALVDCDKQLTPANARKEGFEANLNRLREDLADFLQKYNQLLETMQTRLQPYGIASFTVKDISFTLVTLNNRLDAWQTRLHDRSVQEKKIQSLTGEISQTDALVGSIGLDLASKQESLSALREEMQRLQKDRSALFGTKDPAQEESCLIKQVTAAEADEKAMRDAVDLVRQQASGLRTKISALKESLSIREPELEKLESSFAASLIAASFNDEQAFLDSRLTVDDRQLLALQAQKIDATLADILSRKNDRESRLSIEKARNLSEASMDDLKNQRSALKDQIKSAGEEIGAFKQRLAANETARIRILEKQALINAQKKECERWDKLHGLIGSADGKKYRNFAQGLTFELMVSQANRQLEKMTDRYLLIRDVNQPLELNVIDNYQAGEIRSTKNLSGGESFIVSLSLALGLSKMASRKVRVDSLFLDEGFGTLDEEALETALETLAGLQQDGKLIGVISHVSALKERIGTQLKIIPGSGGKSTISGPGVQRL